MNPTAIPGHYETRRLILNWGETGRIYCACHTQLDIDNPVGLMDPRFDTIWKRHIHHITTPHEPEPDDDAMRSPHMH